MLGWISILGGVLLRMRGQDRSEPWFYCARREDQVSESHRVLSVDPRDWN
jgi:hypothetical protein